MEDTIVLKKKLDIKFFGGKIRNLKIIFFFVSIKNI